MPRKFERPTEEVEIAGRRFVLAALSGAQLERYLRWQVRVADQAIEELRGAAAPRLDDAAMAVLRRESEEFAWLLRTPADDQPAPTAEWVLEHLGPAERQWLLEVQQELLQLDGTLGKAFALLQMARAAGTPTSPGPTSSTP